jgi:group II intron reverse transcriptase/maturase
VLDCIEPYFERHFLPCSFGYRPGRSIAQVVQVIIAHRQAHRRWVANIDIKDCFDSLNPDLLLHFVHQQVTDPLILKLIKAWLSAQIFNEMSGVKATAGASQGAVISPLLSNVYLHQVDVLLAQQQYALIRYADNMLICCRQKGEAEQALQAAAGALKQVRLEINPHKSGVVHFDQGFQFLGVFFLRNEYFQL